MNTLKNLAISNNKANKTRSILIIISVALTTILLTVISTWGYGLIKVNRENAGAFYGSYYGTYNNVTDDELKEMNLRSEFSQIGKLSYVGEIENKLGGICTVDDTVIELTNLDTSLESGKFPQKENEIVGQASFFQMLGYENVNIGDTISLNYREDNYSKYVTNEFVVSGIIKESEPKANSYVLYVSNNFYNSLKESDEMRYKVYFTLDESININYDIAKDLIEEIGAKCCIDQDRISVNLYYIMWAFDPGIETITICMVIALLVIVFSVIVIYNIFQVGITQKVWEYGKVKALGATKRQLRKLILREGMSLAFIGTPVGLLIGCIIAVSSFNWLIQQSSYIQVVEVGKMLSILSIPLLLLVGLVSIITVWLALRRSMKIASSISAIEAIRYQETTKNKKGIRKGKKEIGTKGLLFANFYANPKRTIITILTMGLSCVMFVIMSNVVANMDVEYEARKAVEHGQILIQLDYSLSDKAYPENNLDSIMKNNPLDAKLIEDIRSLDKVTEVTTRDIMPVKMNDNLRAIAIFNKEDFDYKVKSESVTGDFSYDSVTNENGIVYAWSYFMESNGYSIGQDITVDIEEESKHINFPVKGSYSYSFMSIDWIMTEDTYNNLGLENNYTGCIWIDCKYNDVEAVRTELEELLIGKEHIEISIYKDALSQTEFQIKTLKLVVYALLGIITLIGFMNMANTIITNMITRKQEFGMLQIVGMTNKQLSYMLQAEGMLFTIGTIIIAIAVGLPMGYIVFQYCREQCIMGINIYHIPFIPIIIMIVSLVLLQTILSFILSKNLKKESLVDRVRYLG